MEKILDNASDLPLSLVEYFIDILRRAEHPDRKKFEQLLDDRKKKGDFLEGEEFVKKIPRVKPPGGLGRVEERPREVELSHLDKWVGKDHLLQEFGYDYREPQGEMARQVLEAFNRGRPAVVEAATGTGKGMAYLAAALEWIKKTGRKILITTHTKTLQDQLINQDLPRLNQKLDEELRVAVLKGMPNHLCLRKFFRVAQRDTFTREEAESLVELAYQAVQNESGDLDRFGRQPFGEDIRALPTTRLYGDCPYYERCFVSRAWRRAKDADIVITNHALFLALYDQLEETPAEEVIVDEAHHLPGMAEHIFGFEIPDWQWAYWKKRLKNSTQFYKRLARFNNHFSEKGSQFFKKWEQNIEQLTATWEEFWSKIKANSWPLKFHGRPELLRKLEDRVRPQKLIERLNSWVGGLLRLEEDIEEENKALAGEINHRRQHLAELRDNFKFFFSGGENYVRWIELEDQTKIIKTTPLHCNRLLGEILNEKCRSATLTSATLTIGDDFDFIKNKTGVGDDSCSLALETPFDYRSQAEFVLLEDGPFPGKTRNFYDYLESSIRAICRHHSGRSLILFNSFRTLNELKRRCRGEFGFPLLVHGEDEGRSKLLEKMVRIPDSVLFGTGTFWEGVDVPGENLQAVVITRLPFPVPDDPLVEARSAELKEEGKNPFRELMLPEAVLKFRQGLGRLIRTATDRGKIYCLDSRCYSRSYGKNFLSGLPEGIPVKTINKETLINSGF